MNAAKTLGLITAFSLLSVACLSASASAQRRVCIETDQGKRVCGRLLEGNDSFNNNFNPGLGPRCDVPGFDEDFYLDAYSDVATAIRQGRFKSACQHYQLNGRFEGRFPRFNEASYLAKNPDVAQAIKAGKYKNAYEHWIKFGRFENRQL
jgi:hypothetical protein